jgi:hypothetical protein
MRKSIIFVAFLMAATVSCQKEMIQAPAKSGNFTIKATREACTDTKAGIDPGTGVFTWNSGDAIGIWTGSSFEKLTTTDDNVSSAKFSGTLSGTPSYAAVFPYSLNASYSDGAINVTLPASYEWKEGEICPAMFAQYANTLSFKHLGGLVMVTLKNVPANAAKFVFNADKDITGEYTMLTTEEIVSKGETTDNNVTYTFTLTEVRDMVFYVPVPVGEYKFGFTLYDAAGNQILDKQGTTTNAVARKVLKKMPAFTCGGEGSTVTTSVPAGTDGTVSLPDTGSDVIVNVAGDCASVKLAYAENGAKPANVTVNTGNYKVGSLAIELPDSHVNVTGGAYTTVTSKTSLSTLVLDETASVENLTIEQGSAEIACDVNTVVVGENVESSATIKVTEEASVESLTVSAGNVTVAGTVTNVEVTAQTSGSESGTETSDAPVVVVSGQVTTLTNNNADATVVAEKTGSEEGSNITTVAGSNQTVKSPSEYYVEKIQAGGTVTLEQDITIESIDIENGKTVVLNLNGHKITSTSNWFAIGIDTGCTLTINGGDGGEISAGGYAVSNAGTLTINGGTYKSSSNAAILNTGTATLNEGSYMGKYSVIDNQVTDNRNLIINGGYYETLSDGSSSMEECVFNNSGNITFNKAISYKSLYSVFMLETPDTGHLNFDKGVSLPMVYVRILSGFTEIAQLIGEEVRSYVADEAALKEAFANTAVNAVFLNQDITLTETIYLSIDKDLNLNGHTLTYTGGGSDAQCSVFRVQDGTFTVKGEAGSIVAADDSHTERNIFWANGETAKIVLEADATYKVGKCTTAGATDWYNVVFANKVGAAVEISAGEFILESTCSKYILNIKNSTAEEKTAGTIYGNISVTGGTFHGYNPATGDDSGSVSTFVADGYAALETEEGSNIWKIQKDAE